MSIAITETRTKTPVRRELSLPHKVAMGVTSGLCVVFQSSLPAVGIAAEHDVPTITQAVSSRANSYLVLHSIVGAELKKPALCTIEPVGTDRNFIASFPEANIFASGESESEAVENLRDAIAAQYKILSSHQSHQLAPRLKQDLAVLINHIRD